jgi:protein-S-isoprenylcysteine O-methyltransferase Ste14
MRLKARLAYRTAISLVFGGAMLFLPAGSVGFWQGWVFLGIIFIPMAFGSIYFYKRDPQLVERRLQSKEKIGEQKVIVRFASLIFFGAFLLPGFDYRYGWSRRSFGPEPLWLMIMAQVVALAGYLMTYWVMDANSYASRTIRVEEGQKVISVGPYRIVRHPMYMGAVISMLFTPLALGSYWAVPAFALIVPVIVLRILNEEKVLRQELAGYSEFCQRTRYRLFPFVW